MTAKDLKVLYETELREELDILRRPYDERMAFWGLLSESRRSEPGELREQDHPDVGCGRISTWVTHRRSASSEGLTRRGSR